MLTLEWRNSPWLPSDRRLSQLASLVASLHCWEKHLFPLVFVELQVNEERKIGSTTINGLECPLPTRLRDANCLIRSTLIKYRTEWDHSLKAFT